MFTDSQELLSDAQALTATAISTKVYDLLPSGGAVGSGRPGGPVANTTVNIAGKPMYLYIYVHTVLDSAGEAATLTATVESSADTSNGSSTVHWTSGLIAEATLATGYWVAKGVALPPGTYKRYVCVKYTVGTENFTSGKVSAWLSDTPQAANSDEYARGTHHGLN
ncbi:hypothetical protein CQ12_13870 [Bradyrhizobium jicamae]|uniref:Uncharacterized protein n=1 Tax=Bradyrhizobium jicamae TaxID=280332 RepID=A0A0R3LP82_9BRAD|nr:hypothetical protein [Bradyrhizobium jicamae]KRR09570.1 hypothetical protein CQ12_13870 [Bradyrhizobium jicamae]